MQINSSAIIIREATLVDIPEIIQLSLQLVIYDGSFDATMDQQWSSSTDGQNFFQDRISNKDGIVLVAIIENTIVGYLVGGLVAPLSYRKIKILAELEEFYVAENYRGQNIGASLVKKFFQWSHSKHADKIRVEVSAGNKRAIKLYKKLGFDEYNLILEK